MNVTEERINGAEACESTQGCVAVEIEDKPEVAESSFSTIPRTQEELDTVVTKQYRTHLSLDQIIIDQSRFYFPSEGTYPYPLIQRIGEGFYLFDGKAQYQMARDNGEENIDCLVFEEGGITEDDLSILAVGSRIATRGGEASYAEVVWGMSKVTSECLNRGFQIPQHGGNRQSGNHDQNNVFIYLAHRFNKGRQRISKFYRHGEYISDEVFKMLCIRRAPKRFFESIQKRKMEKVEKLRTSGKSDTAIMEEISEFVKRKFEQFERSSAQAASQTEAISSGQEIDTEQRGEEEHEPDEPNDHSDSESGSTDASQAGTEIPDEKVFEQTESEQSTGSDDGVSNTDIPAPRENSLQTLRTKMTEILHEVSRFLESGEMDADAEKALMNLSQLCMETINVARKGATVEQHLDMAA